MPTVTPFERYVNRKEELAAAARLSGFYTAADEMPGPGLVSIGNDWTRRLFDGDFYRSGPADAGVRFEHFLVDTAPV